MILTLRSSPFIAWCQQTCTRRMNLFVPDCRHPSSLTAFEYPHFTTNGKWCWRPTTLWFLKHLSTFGRLEENEKIYSSGHLWRSNCYMMWDSFWNMLVQTEKLHVRHSAWQLVHGLARSDISMKIISPYLSAVRSWLVEQSPPRLQIIAWHHKHRSA